MAKSYDPLEAAKRAARKPSGVPLVEQPTLGERMPSEVPAPAAPKEPEKPREQVYAEDPNARPAWYEPPAGPPVADVGVKYRVVKGGRWSTGYGLTYLKTGEIIVARDYIPSDFERMKAFGIELEIVKE